MDETRHIPTDGAGMFAWLETYIRRELGDVASALAFSLELTVSGSHVGRIDAAGDGSGRRARPIIKVDVLADRLRLYFPVAWGDPLAAWLGEPPAPDYYLKSNWVTNPSIGILASTPDAFARLASEIVTLLRTNVAETAQEG